MYCDSLKALDHMADKKANLGFQTPSTLVNIMLPLLESSICINMYTFMAYNVYKYTLCFSMSVMVDILAQDQASG